ncbi:MULTISPECIES: HNH endonuclease [Geobacillus]|uniref:HNH endonuclease n=2 Tax=Anoxybacillaceae TaxID=3120669 RepID=UPI0006E5E871|nr:MULTISPECIES: HNH endonuclease [Geobacillus]KQB91414.1 hypothetical protein GEPA3_3604 [Geobacillus sp. PA-3]MED4919411.1 hypothetical protein [Geobacillus thermodenitrificans]PJW19151.1 hypothetical protein CV632_17735 [Geobacillus thermodenitrificans]QNU32348.1 hypothetical protein IC804_06365 [Geobacillus sp. 47C-IIb]
MTVKQPRRWVDEIIDVLNELGGQAHLSEIYDHVKKRGIMNISKTYEATIRRTIETHSSDSDAFYGNEDLFYSVHGKGSGVWGLRNILSNQEIQLFKSNISHIQEQELESLIQNASDEDINRTLSNFDHSGSIELKQTFRKIRKVSRKTVQYLKEIYNYSCQICGVNHQHPYGVNVVEAHHIEYFSISLNHQPSNIVILCPTHHRLVHAGKAIFDRDKKVFRYINGFEEPLKINKHL